MKFKKSVSALAALTLSVTAFAGLAVTANAEDTYTTVYDKQLTGDNAWSETDKTEWNNSSLIVDESHGLYFNPTKPGAPYSASKTFDITDNAKVKYDIQWYVGNSTGRNVNYEYLQIGDIRLSYNSTYNFYLNTNGTSSDDSGSILYSKAVNTYPVSLTVNTATKTVENFTFNSIDLTAKVTGTVSGDLNTVSFGLQRGGSTSNWAYPNGLSSITVSQLEQEVTTADYTVNYYLDSVSDENLLTSDSLTGVLGETITPSSVIDKDGEKYYYVSDDINGRTIADGVVVNVIVRAPYTYTAELKSSLGDVIESKEGLKEYETNTFYYPRYIVKDNVAYLAPSTSGNNSSGYNKTATYDNQSITVDYTQFTTDGETAVYYSEGENIDGFKKYNDTARASCGASGQAGSEPLTITTLPSGKYKVVSATRYGNESESYTLKAGDTTIAEHGTHGYWVEYVEDNIDLAEETAITAEGNGPIDYILIIRTGDYTPEAPTATAEYITTIAKNADQLQALHTKLH